MQKENEQKKSAVALREEVILEYWKENKIFEKSLEKESQAGNFVFYDGPPYATGEPHYGHLLPGTIKDVIPRYKTMQGFRVNRQWGWDCHGLPIENLIEKELGLKSKKEIEEYGIDRFNEAARNSVLRYESTWKEMIPRTGRWADMENPYMTMTPNFMESVWWAFKTMYDKGLVNKGFKPMHICPRCETPLANFEVNQGYTDIKDLTVIAKFKLKTEQNTYFLAWTTTPWTLPGNVALAVGNDIEYIKIKSENSVYILAEALVEKVFKDVSFEIIGAVHGKDLIGLSYEPIFNYYAGKVDHSENGWKVYAADFVTTEDGTGIVHIAPAFGSDDLALGQRENLPFIQHVNIRGEFKSEVTDFEGMVVKKKDDSMSADIEIIKYLAGKELLFSKEKITHSYPLCWRCDTPLLNYATDSWFIDVPKIKDRLLANNAKTEWIPEHVRDGRFGKWLEGAREWAVSRSRYWGTPLPVWQKESGDFMVIGSVEDLKKHSQKSGNTYFVMRHGEAENNIKHVWDSSITSTVKLTDTGIQQVKDSAQSLKDKKIDLIICSPLLRTKMTAEIVADTIGYPKDSIVFDERLREVNPGEVYQGKPLQDFLHQFPQYKDRYLHENAEGENYADVKRRVMGALYDFEKTYQGKNILIFSHGGVIMNMIIGARGLKHEEIPDNIESLDYPKNAEWKQLDFIPLPHNDNYELDLHRPYIDRIKLVDENGNSMTRVEDVFDVWFDSGSMPYAKAHYPFENKDEFEQTFFPANFIAEGQDQTRGWFYTLSVIGTALFDRLPFEKVIVNGMVLAEDGKKMSKRLKNYPEISYMLNMYGADAVRMFLMSSPAVHAEDVNFVEKTVAEISRKIFGRLDNVYTFYSLYQKDRDVSFDVRNTQNVLDQWILLRLNEVVREVTAGLESYMIDQAARPFDLFVDDLSTWYLRRSRDRFKEEESEDAIAARGTLSYVLRTTATLLAPFAPFIAEDLYRKLGGPDMKESVHLENWPVEVSLEEAHETVITDMAKAREIVSLGLEARQKVGIKVKQPLNKLQVTSYKLQEAYLELVKDEVNVKNVELVASSQSPEASVILDTEITPELKREGEVREFIRAVQDLRKQGGLVQDDNIRIEVQTSAEGQSFLNLGKETIMPIVGARDIVFVETMGDEVKIGDYSFTIKVVKE